MGIAVCPIQQNWMELPEIIRYGNKLNIRVYFNRVWDPPECSISRWNSENLHMVYEGLKDEVFLISTDIQSKNVQHYKEFVRQVQSWYLESLGREKESMT